MQSRRSSRGKKNPHNQTTAAPTLNSGPVLVNNDAGISSIKSGGKPRQLRLKNKSGPYKGGTRSTNQVATASIDANDTPQSIQQKVVVNGEVGELNSQHGQQPLQLQDTSTKNDPTRARSRKRVAKGDPLPLAPPHQTQLENIPLFAVDTITNVTWKVNIILASQPYSSSHADMETLEANVGVDGNQHYCQVCSGFGDVVCCDGCPRVFHHDCVPQESLSRQSLDNDDDPWYCPNCYMNRYIDENAALKKKGTSRFGQQGGGDRRSISRRCADCKENRPELALQPCKECGVYVHTPFCQDVVNSANNRNVPVCSNCRVIEHLEEGSDSAIPEALEDNENNDDTQEHKKRRKSLSPTSGAPLGEKRKKKKKKKLKRSNLSRSDTGLDEASVPPIDHEEVKAPAVKVSVDGPPVKAMPAFCFYLAENRWKIERALARSHRTFNRLPKGDERNAVIAGEAADWWTKLTEKEQKQYITMSMRDFESRVIQWKEDKAQQQIDFPCESEVLQEKTADNFESANETDSIAAEAHAPVKTRIDAALTTEKYERLFLNSSVGSKPFKIEIDQSYNRVLLDILHDMRFHPLPMFCINRPESSDQVIDEHNAKVTIPYYDVHGPISTSIGDECLGCARGWTHFCSVLQRRVPAVEHRAKLQPPLTSLVSTRIGLGLRPRVSSIPTENARPDCVIFRWRNSDEQKQISELQSIPSSTLTEPSNRMDDMVQFIEETTAMKVPMPPPPPSVKIDKPKKSAASRMLPMQRNNLSLEEDATIFKKCGRCRTLIVSETGCHQCRRAQLVINKSRKYAGDASKGDDKMSMLKVHTAVLSRTHGKELNPLTLSEGDSAVSEAMLKYRWCPSAVLPPQRLRVPSNSQSKHDNVSADESDTETSDSLMSNESNVKAPSKVKTSFSTEQPIEETGGDPLLHLKRPRSIRNATTQELSERDRKHLEVLRLFKKEAVELQRKTLQIACSSILLSLIRRDPFHLFTEPVNVEGYALVVTKPIDFNLIKERLREEKYPSLTAFVSDARLLCDNALLYNPVASVYYKTAKEMRKLLDVMQKRAQEWIGVIKDAHTNYLLHQNGNSPLIPGHVSSTEPFAQLREKWPSAVDMLDNEEELQKCIEADFTRTQENEVAYYGALAVRRAATAAESSLAHYPDSRDMFSVVCLRNHSEDEELRRFIDTKVVEATQPMQLQCVSTWREESLVRLMRKVQKIRLERRTITENGCSRCDGILMDEEWKMALNADNNNPGKPFRKKGDGDIPRVDHTRILLTTGLGSAKTCQKIVSHQPSDGDGDDNKFESVLDACVSVRGSRTHGMGLFADQPFNKNELVAEYIGEYVVNPVADKREKIYGEQRIQDYQFRLDDKLVIDATKKGGHGRYINHSCTPNCRAKIVPGEPPNEHLRRVLIIAQRNIDLNEEITYDYQFPLELDLDARIPCNCQSEACRGFMNWDLPEKGSNNRALLVQKRGANMRDRIRRLGRPLKRADD